MAMNSLTNGMIQVANTRRTMTGKAFTRPENRLPALSYCLEDFGGHEPRDRDVDVVATRAGRLASPGPDWSGASPGGAYGQRG